MPKTKNAQKHVHPTIAWFAVFGCSLVGCLTYAMLYAQAAEAPGSSASDHQVPACRQACYTAYSTCAQTAGDDQNALAQCKTVAGQCVSSCGPDNVRAMGEQKPKLSACAQSCFSTRNDCMKGAQQDTALLHQCNTAAVTCVRACGPQGGGEGQQGYQAAVQAARQRYLDGQKKLLDDFQAALEKAWKSYATSPAPATSGQQ